MWNLSFAPPDVVEAKVLTTLPAVLRRPGRTAWSDANKPGQQIDSFLEGPVFDDHGNLYVTDIPSGRILRITPALDWQVVAEYDGWPNGMARHADGSLWIADYRSGILRLDPSLGHIEPVVAHRNSESFKGVNDLVFDAQGNLYFTDQGQTGLHDATGRVYRLAPQGRLDLLLANAPSPNGIALCPGDSGLFIGITRANQVWRAPLMPDGSLTKVGAFHTFFGTSGPDGLVADARGGLVVAHASLGVAFVLNALGEVTHVVRSPCGRTVTNAALRPGTSTLVMTESATGSILVADLPASPFLPGSA
jgi:gluconolactonase